LFFEGNKGTIGLAYKNSKIVYRINRATSQQNSKSLLSRTKQFSHKIPTPSAKMFQNLSIQQLEAKLFNLRSIRDSMNPLADNIDKIDDRALKARCVKLRKCNVKKWGFLEQKVLLAIEIKQRETAEGRLLRVNGELTHWTRRSMEEDSSLPPEGSETFVFHLLEMFHDDLVQ
jgi:hypothetical protein